MYLPFHYPTCPVGKYLHPGVGSLYTHSAVARTYCLRTSAHLHACEHTHGSRLSVKKVCCMRMSHISISPSLSYVSPILAVPLRSLRDHLPDPKARVKRTSARAPRSLATWPIPRTPQVMSPNSSTRLLLWTVTRRPSTIRTTITSLTSRTPHARTLDCSVFPQCLKPLFRTFLVVIFLFREKAKKACLRKPL